MYPVSTRSGQYILFDSDEHRQYYYNLSPSQGKSETDELLAGEKPEEKLVLGFTFAAASPGASRLCHAISSPGPQLPPSSNNLPYEKAHRTRDGFLSKPLVNSCTPPGNERGQPTFHQVPHASRTHSVTSAWLLGWRLSRAPAGESEVTCYLYKLEDGSLATSVSLSVFGLSPFHASSEIRNGGDGG
ncbi:hypothetical protein BJV74DRAFT_798286 [Russula compacta]|nr:hypothetical protein BJV74DRAFT_798286 [Russula compacta]